MSREFLERMTVVEVAADGDRAAASLEALFHTPLQGDAGEHVPPALLLPGVPGLGGTMDHAVMAEVAWAISQLGAGTLRINFEGVGASSKTNGHPIWFGIEDIEPKDLDRRISHATAGAITALSQLRETVSKTPPVIVGFAFGALVAANVAQKIGDDVARVVLISPPMIVGAWDPVAVEGLSCDVDLLLPQEDAMSPATERDRAKNAGLWPATIADADANFVRGLSSLGQQVVQRAFGS